MPKVSFLIVSFNHQRFIEKAISSALAQNISDMEVIVVDDGSTDQSVALAKRYESDGVQVIQRQNGGPSVAANQALEAASGDIVVMIGADDVCMPNLVSSKLEVLAKQKADVVFSRPKLLNEAGTQLPDREMSIFFKPNFQSEHDLFSRLFHRGNFLCAPGVMIRREILEKYGCFHSGLYQLQDFELWVRLTPHCHMWLSEDRDIHYRLRQDGGNLSNRKNKWRMRIEQEYVYNHFFDNVPHEFLKGAFSPFMPFTEADGEQDAQIERALIYLTHRKGSIQLVGLQKLLHLMMDPHRAKYLATRYGLSAPEVHRLIAAASGMRDGELRGTESPARKNILKQGLEKILKRTQPRS